MIEIALVSICKGLTQCDKFLLCEISLPPLVRKTLYAVNRVNFNQPRIKGETENPTKETDRSRGSSIGRLPAAWRPLPP